MFPIAHGRLSDLVLRKLSQFVSENKVPVNQSSVLVYVNRAHPPSDRSGFFMSGFRAI